MDLVDLLLEFLVFQTENFGQKNQIGGGGGGGLKFPLPFWTTQF
jgi:hypothetical protein